MKHVLKSYLTDALGAVGGFPTGVTPTESITALIARLRPVATDRPLVRFGPATDGGYLVPDDLAGIAACFSPGVNQVSAFERACAERGMDVYLADRSVDGPAEQHPRFVFTKKFVGVTTNDDFMTLDDWVRSSIGDRPGDLLLQIDIEGFEYEVFLAASDALMRRFRIIVAEFHAIEQLWSRPFFQLASRAFDKVLQTHTCVHIHPNNCCGSLTKDGIEIPTTMEFTFVRNDRVSRRDAVTAIPHPLDVDNTAGPTLVLPEVWYRRD